MPRFPHTGLLDFTYRCNNNCRHCWLWLPANAPDKERELSFDEILRIVNEARALGCREWSLSGGEPMLRPDFPEIFDYITRKAAMYHLNTNGTLITPEIAHLLKRPSRKMIALYGATPDVYDHVARHPGGFEQLMRRIAYLQEAGAGFMLQLVPMKANYYQWKEMIALADSLGVHWRCGAPWLWLSASGSPERNAEIIAQRLPPEEVVVLDRPSPSYAERMAEVEAQAQDLPGFSQHHECNAAGPDDRILMCAAQVDYFHVDPYGQMCHCLDLKDQALRYDLRRGTFREAWEEFLPSLAESVRGGGEYRENCGSCDNRAYCRWCPARAYLEARRLSAPVPYLCEAAAAKRHFMDEWRQRHLRYFQIAGMTVRVESDLNLDEIPVDPKHAPFAADGPGDDNVTLRHIFGMPDLKGQDLGTEVYRKPPWAISRKGNVWVYMGISPSSEADSRLHRLVVFNADHTHATIYSPKDDEARVKRGGFHSLSLMPTDQLWLAPLLADRQACLIHSAAAIVDGQGLVFVGHSEAGKSTTVTMLKTMLKARAEILCDDRNIVRRWPDGFRVYGTWSHGDVPDVSGASAPLRAILFLHQDTRNEIRRITDTKEVWKRLLACLIKSLVTAAWWQKELDVLEQLVREVPCYAMHFDKSGEIADVLARLVAAPQEPWHE